MDDIIYILLFVGWIIYSFYSAVQKKKKKELKTRSATEHYPQPETTESGKTGRSVLEEMFGEQFDVLKELEEEKPVFEEATQWPTVRSYKNPEYQQMQAANNEVLVSQLTDSEASDFNEPVLNEKTTKQENYFDLRKAVIYKAVLERPYS